MERISKERRKKKDFAIKRIFDTFFMEVYCDIDKRFHFIKKSDKSCCVDDDNDGNEVDISSTSSVEDGASLICIVLLILISFWIIFPPLSVVTG